MGNQRQDDSNRNQSNQQQGQSGNRQPGQQNDATSRPGAQQGDQSRSSQQGGAGGNNRQQEQQRGKDKSDSPRTPDEISQGDMDAGSIGSEEKDDRSRQGSGSSDSRKS